MNRAKIAQAITELEREARKKGMEVDYETATLRVPFLRTLTPHQRDFAVRAWQRSQYWADINDQSDRTAMDYLEEDN